MRWGKAIAAALLVLTGAQGAAASDAPLPSYVEETASAGIASVYAGDWEFMVGGGVATFDCNADGFPDMLLAGGTAPATFYRNESTQGGPLAFTAAPSGLEIDKVTGAYPLDIDSDGLVDLVLLRRGENVVMRGDGNCRFTRANEAWGFEGGAAWTTALAAIWERGATWPTLAIGNYIDPEAEAFPWGSCTDNWLHRPDAVPGRFAAPLALKPSFCALSLLFTDWNRSGTPSLRISNDREYYKGGQEQLWRIDPGQPPRAYTADDGWKQLRVWGMGIASYDLNSDGYPEYFLTSMADNKLQSLDPRPADAPPDAPMKPGFGDIAFARGVTAHRPYTGGEFRPSTAWHAQFEDVNNDGLADLFIAKGNVAEMPDFARKDPNNLLIQQVDGTFVEAGATAGVASMRTSRGAMVVDFNLDGLLDLVVVNRWESAQLWRNTTPDAGHWIQMRLHQPAPNVDAIGAWIEVRSGDRVQRREVSVGGGHASGHLGWWHFGIGPADRAEVRVIWPDGTEGAWQSLDADRFHDLARDAPDRIWTPK